MKMTMIIFNYMYIHEKVAMLQITINWIAWLPGSKHCTTRT